MDKRALFFEDGSFAFPLFVKSVADVPEDVRDCYNPDPAGDYKLKDLYWNELRLPFEREYEQLERQIADLKTKHETDMTSERQARIDAAVSRACKDAGISDGLLEGAAALMAKRATFELDASGAVLANTGSTRTSLEGLIGTFLDSDEGAGFRGKRRATPSDGYFTGLLARR